MQNKKFPPFPWKASRTSGFTSLDDANGEPVITYTNADDGLRTAPGVLDTIVATMNAAGSVLVAGWIHEDELPSGYPYDVMFAHSKVDGVRMFPVFVPPCPGDALLGSGLARDAVDCALNSWFGGIYVDFREATKEQFRPQMAAAVATYIAFAGCTFPTTQLLRGSPAKYLNTKNGWLAEIVSELNGLVTFHYVGSDKPYYLGRSEFDTRFQLQSETAPPSPLLWYQRPHPGVRPSNEAADAFAETAVTSPNVMHSDPVAYVYPETLEHIMAKRDNFEQHMLSLERVGNFTSPLYAAPTPVSHVGGVPAGWTLVPIEPTLDMVMAGETAWERGLDARLDAKPRIEYPSEEAVELAARVAYRAMTNAAPSPEVKP